MITRWRAFKADNSDLINSRVPGAGLLTSRCLRQGHDAEVTGPFINSGKPEIAVLYFRRVIFRVLDTFQAKSSDTKEKAEGGLDKFQKVTKMEDFASCKKCILTLNFSSQPIL